VVGTATVHCTKDIALYSITEEKDRESDHHPGEFDGRGKEVFYTSTSPYNMLGFLFWFEAEPPSSNIGSEDHGKYKFNIFSLKQLRPLISTLSQY
jgi:hypothetical protein